MRLESNAERLVAEQAVLHYRELQRIMQEAPSGKGMAVLEQAVREKGFEQMRQALALLANAHPEAQKKRDELPALHLRSQGPFQARLHQASADGRGRNRSLAAILPLWPLRRERTAV